MSQLEKPSDPFVAEVDDYDDFEEAQDRYCYNCGGQGYLVVCPDDLCHGRDECIHGDPPVICPVCKGVNLL